MDEEQVANAAAVPTPWPTTAQVAITRVEAKALEGQVSWSVEREGQWQAAPLVPWAAGPAGPLASSASEL